MSEVERHYGMDDETGTGRTARTGDGIVHEATRRLRGAREEVGEAYEHAADWASDSYEAVARNARYARRRSLYEMEKGRQSVVGFVEENPIMVGVAGLALGLLVGSMLPGTRRENRVFGRYADEVRTQGYRYAQDVAEQGRQILEDNVRNVAAGVRQAADDR